MKMTRRSFSAFATVSAAAAAAGLPRPAWGRLRDEPTVFQWRQVGDDAYVASGQGGNALLIIVGNEAVLVDCKNTGYGHSLRRECERHGAPIRHVVNTHHHADHTGGNSAFVADVPVIAHQAAHQRVVASVNRYRQAAQQTAQRLRNSDDPADKLALRDASAFLDRAGELTAEDFAPTTIVERRHEFTVGPRTMILRYVMPGHTDNDLYLQDRRLNLLHTGDLVFNKLHPFFDQQGGVSLDGWIRSVRTMITLCDSSTIVVPGHGDIGGVEAIRDQIIYLERTRDAVAAAIDDGRSRDEIVKMTFPHFEGLGFEQVRERALGAVYDELTAATQVGPSPTR